MKASVGIEFREPLNHRIHTWRHWNCHIHKPAGYLVQTAFKTTGLWISCWFEVGILIRYWIYLKSAPLSRRAIPRQLMRLILSFYVTLVEHVAIRAPQSMVSRCDVDSQINATIHLIQVERSLKLSLPLVQLSGNWVMSTHVLPPDRQSPIAHDVKPPCVYYRFLINMTFWFGHFAFECVTE